MSRANYWFSLVAMGFVFIASNAASAQTTADERRCLEATRLSSGTHRFRREWESFEIVVADKTPGGENCQVMSLELRWSNGRNNGSNFNVTFVDANNRPIYTRHLTGFLTGSFDFPLSLSGGAESRPWLGTPWMLSIPATITVQAVPPFAAPSNISYSVNRVFRPSRTRTAAAIEDKSVTKKRGNEIVKIRETVRLIGATRVPLVQVELKTSEPLPVKDVPLQLRIGKKVFVDELSGDHSGRVLTLNLTPEMFAELEEGADVVAFFEKSEAEVWNFGKLRKAVKSEQ